MQLVRLLLWLQKPRDRRTLMTRFLQNCAWLEPLQDSQLSIATGSWYPACLVLNVTSLSTGKSTTRPFESSSNRMAKSVSNTAFKQSSFSSCNAIPSNWSTRRLSWNWLSATKSSLRRNSLSSGTPAKQSSINLAPSTTAKPRKFSVPPSNPLLSG